MWGVVGSDVNSNFGKHYNRSPWSFQAVCCSDHEHCCPQGYICNVAEQTCDRPGVPSLSWLQKVPALRDVPAMQEEAVSSLARPDRNMCDHKTSCPRDTTCCFMAESQRWGCCPLPSVSQSNHFLLLSTNSSSCFCFLTINFLFCRPCVAATEPTAAPVLTPVILNGPPAPEAPSSSPGSPNWRPWLSRAMWWM